MGTYLQYVNSDEIYNNTTCAKIIVNDLPNRSQKDKATINSLLMLEVGEVFDNVPRCSCGALSMKMYKGVRCKKCDTVVEEIVTNNLDDKIWVRAPEGVPALMNIKIWYQLQTYLQRSSFKFNLLQWLTDPDYKPKLTKMSAPIRKALQKLDEHGLNVRSYQFFYDNFDRYMEFLLLNPEFNTRALERGPELYRLIMENRKDVWVQYVQIPNRALTIIEKSNGKQWVDASTPKLLKAVRRMVGIDNDENLRSKTSAKTKQSRTSKFLSEMAEYYGKEIDPNYLSKKYGLFRKHIDATRSHFSARFVVTAITELHRFDEVWLPWVGAMSLLGPHIRSKLYKKGYSSNKVMAIMTKYQMVYNEEIHKIMTELIDESRAPCGEKGIPILLNRNPTLKHGSIVLLRVTRIKTDPRDMSASTSGPIAPLYNGDFDGDTENFLLLLDNITARALQPFEPKYSVNNLIEPYMADGVTSLPKPTTMSIAVAMTKEQNPTKEQLDFMSQFVA